MWGSGMKRVHPQSLEITPPRRDLRDFRRPCPSLAPSRESSGHFHVVFSLIKVPAISGGFVTERPRHVMKFVLAFRDYPFDHR